MVQSRGPLKKTVPSRPVPDSVPRDWTGHGIVATLGVTLLLGQQDNISNNRWYDQQAKKKIKT